MSIDAFILKHQALVYHIAWKIARPIGLHDDEVNEMIADGMVGLVRAAPRFDPDRGLAASTFLAPRIRGAISDGLRTRDRLSRTVRRKETSLKRTRDQLHQLLHRSPSELELATDSDMSLDTFRRHVLHALEHNSLEDPVGEDLTISDVTPADPEPTTDDLDDARHTLIDALTGLRPNERYVISLYYFEEMTMLEIATIMGVTESRISQVHKQALQRLREAV